MTNILQNILNNLNQKISLDDISLKDKNIYLILEKDLDYVLEIIFEYCSTNIYCFNIDRSLYNECDVTIFSNNTNLSMLFKIKSDSNLLLEKLHILKYKIIKKISIIPIIGPDGVGKTTILDNVVKEINEKFVYRRFKKIVRRSIIYNIIYPINKYFLKKSISKDITKDQHDDIHYLLALICGYFYFCYLSFIGLFSKKVIFIDRFFNDYLLENISFKEKETKIRDNWLTLVKFFPTVLWNIQLDARNEIILSRKDELTSDDIDKYRDFNFQIYLQNPSFIYTYINTGLDLAFCKNILLHSGAQSKIFNMENVIATNTTH